MITRGKKLERERAELAATMARELLSPQPERSSDSVLEDVPPSAGPVEEGSSSAEYHKISSPESGGGVASEVDESPLFVESHLDSHGKESESQLRLDSHAGQSPAYLIAADGGGRACRAIEHV